MKPILELAQEIMAGQSPAPPINRLLGFVIKAVEPGHAIFEMAVDEQASQPDGNSARR